MRSRGFTLIELLLVLAILGVVFALVIPELSGFAQSQQLRESAERMRGLFARCRAEAMNQTLRYRVRFRQDGSLNVMRQADAMQAPQVYVAAGADWASADILLDGVWVESVEALPEGPPPILIIDEKLQFQPEDANSGAALAEADQATDMFFSPEGACNSLRLVLRDRVGRGLLLTYDGRLGRMIIDENAVSSVEGVKRPEALPAEKPVKYVPEERL